MSSSASPDRSAPPYVNNPPDGTKYLGREGRYDVFEILSHQGAEALGTNNWCIVKSAYTWKDYHVDRKIQFKFFVDRDAGPPAEYALAQRIGDEKMPTMSEVYNQKDKLVIVLPPEVEAQVSGKSVGSLVMETLKKAKAGDEEGLERLTKCLTKSEWLMALIRSDDQSLLKQAAGAILANGSEYRKIQFFRGILEAKRPDGKPALQDDRGFFTAQASALARSLAKSLTNLDALPALAELAGRKDLVRTAKNRLLQKAQSGNLIWAPEMDEVLPFAEYETVAPANKVEISKDAHLTRYMLRVHGQTGIKISELVDLLQDNAEAFWWLYHGTPQVSPGATKEEIIFFYNHPRHLLMASPSKRALVEARLEGSLTWPQVKEWLALIEDLGAAYNLGDTGQQAVADTIQYGPVTPDTAQIILEHMAALDREIDTANDQYWEDTRLSEELEKRYKQWGPILYRSWENERDLERGLPWEAAEWVMSNMDALTNIGLFAMFPSYGALEQDSEAHRLVLSRDFNRLERYLDEKREGGLLGRRVAQRRRLALKDLLQGGLGDLRPDEDFDSEALAEGTKVESEHTDDDDVAREIAKDHLTEDPVYYKKLRAIERKRKALSRWRMASLVTAEVYLRSS